MSAQPYKLRPDSELARLLDRAGRRPVVLESAGVRYRVVREVDDPWASYDPDKMRQAIEQSAGALEGVDVAALLRELDEAREQDTPGRPA